ncbi:ATP-binding cassette domain-containing protein [Streptococcus suis]|nr:ATP-binding cassette domain-containing protein [Streptococcus suis]
MEVKNLSYTHNQKKIFSNISFNTADNPLIVIEGKNGTGKSTLLKVLLGIRKIQSGQVISDESIGYVPDSSETYFVGMSPQVLFHFLKRQFAISEAVFEKRLSDLIKRFNFSESLMSKTIQNLSLGEKKKVMLISAFLIEPKLFVMDEPFSGLDENSLEELSILITDSLKQGKVFIIVTHGYDELLPSQKQMIYL